MSCLFSRVWEKYRAEGNMDGNKQKAPGGTCCSPEFGREPRCPETLICSQHVDLKGKPSDAGMQHSNLFLLPPFHSFVGEGTVTWVASASCWKRSLW